MDMQNTDQPISSAFIQALRFPFALGSLIYNLVAALLLAALLSQVYVTFQTQLEHYQAQQKIVAETPLPDKQQAEIEQALKTFEQSGASAQEIETLRVLMKTAATMEAQPELTVPMDSPTAFSLPTTLLILVISFAVMSKNLDITAQIADGDLSAPSLLPTSYVSPFIILKYLAVYLLLSLAFIGIAIVLGLLTVFIPFAIVLIYPLLLLTVLAYPAIVLTLINTNSIVDSINPGKWMDTINNHVGQLNYLALLALLFLVFCISFTIQILFFNGLLSSQFILLFITTFIGTYLSMHFVTANHFLMGYMTQHGHGEATPEFNTYEKKKTPKKSTTQSLPILDDVNSVVASGYHGDAISLLNNELAQDKYAPADTLTLLDKLEHIHQSQGNAEAAKQTQKRALDFVMTKAPALKNRVLLKALALIKAGEFVPTTDETKVMAEAALSQSDYPCALKLAAKLIQSQPNHPDVNDCYVIAAKAFNAQGQYKKAYQAYAKVLKALPENDPKRLDIKSELAMLKRKLTS